MPPKRARKIESEDEGSEIEEAEVSADKPSSKSATTSTFVPTLDKQTDAEGNTYFEISGKRRVTVRSFKDLKLVDIREMYADRTSGELKPGKKGISLSEEQFIALVNIQGSITEALNNLEVGASTSRAKKTAKPAKATKEKPASKPASKPAAKKKARKEISESEDDEE
ncbi:PC4-domain-containing protein [Ceratobasidium sp. AG-I]|nr:PC4-domain-containing protein [Ceratobasidium sp. AG-I]